MVELDAHNRELHSELQHFRYPVKLVDESYYKDVISCQAACPVHTDASGYANAVASCNSKAGYLIARQPNPFTSVCGRVCNAPCETACRRNKIDSPITIRALKRYLCEYYGVESEDHIDIRSLLNIDCANLTVEDTDLGNSRTVDSLSSILRRHKMGKSESKKGRVAVIGAGPAGLTAAHDLAAMGYETTIFEAASAPGGMLLLGIPEYRLPRDVLEREIEDILGQGVEIRLNTQLGLDFTLGSLKSEGYEAVFLAVGAHRNVPLGLEGEELEGVVSGIEFLRKVNLGQTVDIGRRVAVVGGGNVAMDTVRTADAVRTASRLGAKKAFILYRRSREEMPAKDIEIEEAIEEGIEVHYQVAPIRILGENGKVRALECIKMELGEPDENGRRRPIPIKGSEFVLEADTVISAIGQVADLSFITADDKISVTPAGTVSVDQTTLATTQAGVFAGGDLAFGPRIIIEAVNDGHKAARSIDRFLQGDKRTIEQSQFNMAEVTRRRLPAVEWLTVPEEHTPTLPVEKRGGFAEVEQGFDETKAIEQASRCLRCNIQTVFDSDKCILCGGCVDVCPRNCYRIVRLNSIVGEGPLASVVEARYGISLDTFQEGGDVLTRGAAIIKEEDSCVRCALCAERCPTGAITMEAFTFRESLAYDD
jgi:NADPH-dependent glutamate synthase beta subunit-like oxidoreductase